MNLSNEVLVCTHLGSYYFTTNVHINLKAEAALEGGEWGGGTALGHALEGVSR